MTQIDNTQASKSTRRTTAEKKPHTITQVDGMGDRVGYLLWARSEGKAAQVNPLALVTALENSGDPTLSLDVPKPPAPSEALKRAVRKQVRVKDYEWRPIGYAAGTGDYVALLCKVTTSAETQDYEASAVAVALVESNGAITLQKKDNAPDDIDGRLSKLEADYSKEFGTLGAPELWKIILAVAQTGRHYLRVKEGMLFVTQKSKEKLDILDAALKEVDSTYRMRMMPFRGADVSVIATDVSAELLREFQTLIADWNERKQKSIASGRSQRRDGAETVYRQVEDLISRYALVREIFGEYLAEFEVAIDTLRQEAADAAQGLVDLPR